MEDETYFIIFPSGDKTKLMVTSLNSYMYYEKNDYSLASRHEWKDEQEAIEYAKKLASENSLEYIGDEDGYLD